jgi:hypothetical protein
MINEMRSTGAQEGGISMSTEVKQSPISRSQQGKLRLPLMLHVIGALLLSALLIIACVESAPAGPVVPLVPADSVAAVIVESPYKLFSSCDAF